MVAWTAAWTLVRSVTSQCTKWASPPRLLARSRADPAAASPAVWSISAMITLAPSSAKRSAVARPMPPPPPVMKATLPTSRPMAFPLAYAARLQRRVGLIQLRLEPHRHMVRGLLPAARVLVDTGGEKPIGRLRGGQNVIDADAVILLPGTGLIIPERVEPRSRQPCAHDVGETEIEESAIGRAGLGLIEGVAAPGLGVLGIDRLGNDVVVAEQKELLLITQQLARACRKALHPGELIGELVGAHRIAIGQIEVADAHDAALAGHAHLDVAGVAVAVIARQAAHGDLVERPLGEDGDAVEALLPMHRGVVAELLEGGSREGLGGRLDLLQADDVRVCLLDPRQGNIESGLDAVDVPGGDFHGGMGVGPAARRVKPPSDRGLGAGGPFGHTFVILYSNGASWGISAVGAIAGMSGVRCSMVQSEG